MKIIIRLKIITTKTENQRQDLYNLFPREPKENLGSDNCQININNRAKTLQKNFY